MIYVCNFKTPHIMQTSTHSFCIVGILYRILSTFAWYYTIHDVRLTLWWVTEKHKTSSVYMELVKNTDTFKLTFSTKESKPCTSFQTLLCFRKWDCKMKEKQNKVQCYFLETWVSKPGIFTQHTAQHKQATSYLVKNTNKNVSSPSQTALNHDQDKPSG